MKTVVICIFLFFLATQARAANVPVPVLAQNLLTVNQFQARQINTLKGNVRELQLAIRCIAENATWVEVKTIDGQPYIVPTDETDPNGVEIPVIQQAAACTGS